MIENNNSNGEYVPFIPDFSTWSREDLEKIAREMFAVLIYKQAAFKTNLTIH
jgi:hypothetical protein